MDAITYALCKKIAAGAVSGVTSMSVSGQTLTINCTDGTVLTVDFPTPADGVSITGVEVNASKHLIVTLSDSSTLDAGEVPTVQGETGLGVKGVTINASNHLIVTFDDDTTEDAGEIKGIHTSFSDITDIAVSELADGQILKYDATSGKWKNVSPGSVDTDLGDLNDVDLTNVQDGQMIAWDAQNSKWVNVTPSADIESLNDIDDVDIANPSNGQILKYNGTSEKWENSDMPTIDATPTSESTNAVQSGGVFTALGNKVDKVSGKGLSTEDYTSEEKTKLSGIETGAEANVQSDWNQSNNAADDFIKNKPSLGTAAAKDATTYVNPGNTDVPTSNAVFTAMSAMMEGAFHPAGSKTCVELTSALLIQANVGNVYKITDNGTTDANWVGGAGQTITANQMAVVVYGNEPNTFLFNLENGINIDMSQYQTKTITPITVDGQQKANVEDAVDAINDLAGSNKTAIGNIKDGANIDSFGDVENALADKQDTLTGGNLVSIDNNTINAKIFVGTRDDWNALSLTDKAKYTLVNITDDSETGETVDAVTDGDMRAVTSNAVFDATNSIKERLVTTIPSNTYATYSEAFAALKVIYDELTDGEKRNAYLVINNNRIYNNTALGGFFVGFNTSTSQTKIAFYCIHLSPVHIVDFNITGSEGITISEQGSTAQAAKIDLYIRAH